MVIKLDKRKFEKHLNNVLKALDSNAHLIALKGILIKALDNQLELLVSNGNLSIKETIPTDQSFEVIQTGKILVPGKLFVQLIKKHSSPLEMSVEKDQLVLKSQNFFSKNNLLDVSEYPQISFDVSGQEIDVDAQALRETIKNVAFVASNRDSNIILNGVNLSAKDDQLIVSATDTYRIARETIPVQTKQDFNITILSRHVRDFVPEHAQGLIRLCLKENKVLTSYQSTQVLLKLIDGIYPNVGKVIPNQFTYRLEIETSELINLVEKALVVYKESSSLNSLSLVLKPQELEILGRENEIGHTEVKSKNITWNGPDFKITFNGNYLKEAASRFKGKVALHFLEIEKPFVLKGESNPNLVQLILPQRQ
ncbi:MULTISPECIES: DNA polymerase III subunit beta [unclassified Mycoplasma]|uniref:DNA polymerase III subunit beta n=1 Tax=unclassified Mycoplasma TaxID=2683645 RepID=UPI000FDEC8A5